MLPKLQEALTDRYTVEREIGHGGAARVFRAHAPDGEVVALKVLHPELLVSTTADRFLREIQICRQLDHPNISHLIDSGERDWLVYYVMRYIEGPTLRAVLDRVRRLSISDATRVATDLLAALAHAHERGIIHRDVKPENVTISPQGAVLLDFGIARAIDRSAAEALTRSGITVGTSKYMSPEQITGTRDLSPGTDLYSLACVLFECLAGRPPFVHRYEAVVLQAHINDPAPDVRTLRPEVPAAFAEAIARALAKKPEDRWPSAAAMRAAIEGGASA
ncbi:MAG TPA: serine/threonine-protein kinase [Gemmatimonadales bacterium]|nr:serine/threonine-protein kinase [Gemmatimonadales bacterium]